MMTENGHFENNVIPDIWKHICKLHWVYLETEESLQKINERKILEKHLLEYLNLVPHDRKFLLSETSHVLKKSISKMKNFSKAKAGFEAISQFANNLFTKPWRKEYKTIKMYSGFFKHEILSNLLDAENLFKAMGYRQMTPHLLVLDEAICPDQVTNVSRDAMAALVECQVLNEICSGLIEIQVQADPLDVYNFRENHYGSCAQMIKMISWESQKLKNDSYYHQPYAHPADYFYNNNSCVAHSNHPSQAYGQPIIPSNGEYLLNPVPNSLPLDQPYPCAMNYYNPGCVQLPSPYITNYKFLSNTPMQCPTIEPTAANYNYGGYYGNPPHQFVDIEPEKPSFNKNPLHGILKKDLMSDKFEDEANTLRGFEQLKIRKRSSSAEKQIPNLDHTNSFSDTTPSIDTVDSRQNSVPKNHREGVGSFESWNYVFENLEERRLKKNGLEGNKKEISTTTSETAAKNTSKDADGWSCKFCTFINPKSLHICEMCSKSKDFNPKVFQSNASRCVKHVK